MGIGVVTVFVVYENLTLPSIRNDFQCRPMRSASKICTIPAHLWVTFNFLAVKRKKTSISRQVNPMLTLRRQLFKGRLKKALEPPPPSHYEYSISPKTYNFKVPSTKQTLNPIQLIYQKAVNFPFDKSNEEVYNSYPKVTANQLLDRKSRPRGVLMSTADFIEDLLYNKHYGYFAKEAEIYHPDKPFSYPNVKDIDGFMEAWGESYSKYEQDDTKPLQLWHTLLSCSILIMERVWLVIFYSITNSMATILMRI